MNKHLTYGLIVRDYDEAVDFYVNKMGFVVAEDADMGEDTQQQFMAGAEPQEAHRWLQRLGPTESAAISLGRQTKTAAQGRCQAAPW